MRKPVPIQIGKRFTRLVVLKEQPTHITKSGNKVRKVQVKCDCGIIKEVGLRDLLSNKTQSCGCLHKEIHSKYLDNYRLESGDYRPRLYDCWISMKRRSKSRKDCNVFKGWLSFEVFKKWALDNGYTDQLVLCRNGDKGDYEPNNCRWDTQENNVKERHEKYWTIIKPCGSFVTIKNLSKFCKEHNLSQSNMSSVASGRLSHHKGYKVKKYEN